MQKDGLWWFGGVSSCNPDFVEWGVSITLFGIVTPWKTEGVVSCRLPATPESLLGVRQRSRTNEKKAEFGKNNCYIKK